MNDADFDAALLAAAGQMLAAGICPACEEVADPFDERWADEIDEGDARSIFDCYGPIDPDTGYHRKCLTGEDF